MLSKLKIQNELSKIYLGKASENRISALADKIVNVIDDVNTVLDEVVFFVDEFEGGSADSKNFDLVLSCVLNELIPNEDNAHRLFDFYSHCKRKDVYEALTGDYREFLTAEQKSVL